MINQLQDFSCLAVAALAHPQSRKTEGDTQLPKQSTLLAGEFACLVVAIFRQRGTIRTLPRRLAADHSGSWLTSETGDIQLGSGKSIHRG